MRLLTSETTVIHAWILISSHAISILSFLFYIKYFFIFNLINFFYLCIPFYFYLLQHSMFIKFHINFIFNY